MTNTGKAKLKKILKSTLGHINVEIVGALGIYEAVTGNKIIKVPNRPSFVYVRIRGQTEEVVEAFNEKVGEQWGTPVKLIKDKTNPRYYYIKGRDTGKYAGMWNDPGLPNHGSQHSFGTDTTAGRDVTFIYRRQFVQPLLCHPQSPVNMTVHVEPDYYYNLTTATYTYFAGGDSANLTADIPLAGTLVFDLIYLDFVTNTILTQLGTPFSVFTPPANLISNVPTLSPDVGLPLAAILLSSTTTSINWDVVFDIRAMMFSPTSSYPKRWTGSHDEATIIAGNALTLEIRVAQAFNFDSFQSAAANADSFSQSMFLQAGTYTLSVLGVTSTDEGKLDWYIDGVIVGTTQDWYSAVLTDNVIKTISSIVIATTGVHKIAGLVNSKNAASTDFIIRLTKYWMKQAAD